MIGTKASHCGRIIRFAAGANSPCTTLNGPSGACAPAGPEEGFRPTMTVITDKAYAGSSLDESEEAPSTGTMTITDEQALEGGQRLLTLNMGPQHPSTHG